MLRIRDPDILPIPDPGVKKAPDPGTLKITSAQPKVNQINCMPTSGITGHYGTINTSTTATRHF